MGIRPVQIQQRDPIESYGKSLALQGLMRRGELEELQAEKERMGLDDSRKLRGVYDQAAGDNARLRALLPSAGPAGYRALQELEKAELEAQAKRAGIGKDKAAAGKSEYETRIGQIQHISSVLAEVQKNPAMYGSAKRMLAATFGPQMVADAPEEYDPNYIASKIALGQTLAQRLTDERGRTEAALRSANEPFLPGPNGPVPNAPVQQFQLDKSAAGRPVTNVSVSTEKKYGEQFAGEMAKADASMRDTALKAPDLALRANQIREVLAGGKVITGTGADVRLAIGKALNLAGANDAETIANTETLSTQLSRNTLDAIKASGLGSGNGFSNADRDFLEKAAGGKITLEPQTIDRLATLAHRAAEQSAKKWGTRVRQIPADALQGTGITAEQIDVPTLYQPKTQPPAAGPKPGHRQDGYIFNGGDPADPKNWKKAS